jgi:predicted metal-dependent peptidase
MNIDIAIDTSGSVTDTDFNRFVSEIHGIFKMMKPEKINLIQFDKSIKSVTKIKNLTELSKVKFTGRGGTDIVPVLDYANEHKPQLLLIFTDGEFYFNDTSTKVNTVWLINNNKRFKSTFGKTIHYEI